MHTTVNCAALAGVAADPVLVEVDLSLGLPAFQIVGLPEGAVRESKVRVLAALGNCGYVLPPRKVTVNLAPADLKKTGAAFDLAIALGLLAGIGFIDGQLNPAPSLENPASQPSSRPRKPGLLTFFPLG